MTVKSSRRPRRPVPRRGRRLPLAAAALAVLLAALAGGLALSLRAGSLAGGEIAAEHSAHDFGQVAITGGPLAARFPLVAQSEAVVTELGTT